MATVRYYERPYEWLSGGSSIAGIAAMLLGTSNTRDETDVPPSPPPDTGESSIVGIHLGLQEQAVVREETRLLVETLHRRVHVDVVVRLR